MKCGQIHGRNFSSVFSVILFFSSSLFLVVVVGGGGGGGGGGSYADGREGTSCAGRFRLLPSRIVFCI